MKKKYKVPCYQIAQTYFEVEVEAGDPQQAVLAAERLVYNPDPTMEEEDNLNAIVASWAAHSTDVTWEVETDWERVDEVQNNL